MLAGEAWVWSGEHLWSECCLKGLPLTFYWIPTVLSVADSVFLVLQWRHCDLRGWAGRSAQLTGWHLVPLGDNWSAVLRMPDPQVFSTWPLSLVDFESCVLFETRKASTEMVYCQKQAPGRFLIARAQGRFLREGEVSSDGDLCACPSTPSPVWHWRPEVLKPFGLSCIRTALWAIHHFARSCFGHLKNIDSVGYADLANVDTFRYTTSNNHKG